MATYRLPSYFFCPPPDSPRKLVPSCPFFDPRKLPFRKPPEEPQKLPICPHIWHLSWNNLTGKPRLLTKDNFQRFNLNLLTQMSAVSALGGTLTANLNPNK